MSGDGFLEGEDNSHKSEPGSLTKPSYDSMNPMREPRKLAFIIDAVSRYAAYLRNEFLISYLLKLIK